MTSVVRRPVSRRLSGDAYADFRGVRRFAALDGLRALSVLAVVWHHTAGTGRPGLAGRGALGVDMFFAISGFLITTLLLRERRSTGRISLGKFYARRSLRIFPLYYLVLLTYIVLVALGAGGNAAEFWRHVPAFATYTSNWFVGLTNAHVTFYFAWSLATEEQFYLFWPPLLVVLLGRRRGRPVAALGALALLCAATIVANSAPVGSAFGWRLLASLSLPILLGAAAALVLDSPQGFRLAAPVLTPRWAAPVLAVGTVALVAVGAPAYLVEVAMVFVVASCCVRDDTPLHRLLTLRPLVSIGAVSYGIYLMHMLAANLVRAFVPQEYGLLVFLPTLAVVIVAAQLSFRFFERPILSAKQRFTPRGAEGGGADRVLQAQEGSAEAGRP